MTETAPINPTPTQVAADAKNRALRTFLWGLLLDAGTAIVVILMTAFTDIRWTKDYWIALGLALAKSVLVAIVSYFARFLIKPPNTTR